MKLTLTLNEDDIKRAIHAYAVKQGYKVPTIGAPVVITVSSDDPHQGHTVSATVSYDPNKPEPQGKD